MPPQGQPPLMLLHSGRYHPRWARQSLLGLPVGTYQFTALGQSRWISATVPCPVEGWSHHPLADLKKLLGATAGRGLWIGYLGYDLGRWIERLPARATEDRHWPVVELGWCPGWAVQDVDTGQWSTRGDWSGPLPASTPLDQPRGAWSAEDKPASIFSRADYEKAVAQVKAYIAAGDVFQVNLAQRFTAHGRGDPRHLFRRLAQGSPAWYGAYLELQDGRVLASTSPELFLEVDEQGRVVTRPIKGTRPATMPAAALRDSEKDIAELNMIVDLLRNDLGRVCNYGSIQVVEPRAIETHPTVHHGVATITGTLHPRKDRVDLLRATLPGGSITGAPKIRAMQIIEELEPVRRGPYCGAIGWISAKALCLNIAIRTLLLTPVDLRTPGAVPSTASPSSRRRYRVDFSVGGGIVADSDPAGEYQETLDKAVALFRALSGQ